jgi:hypothetical protein
VTRGLKDAILLAAETVGEDGKGKNGLHGYLVARPRTDLFMRMLVEVMQLQIKSKPEPRRSIGSCLQDG